MIYLRLETLDKPMYNDGNCDQITNSLISLMW